MPFSVEKFRPKLIDSFKGYSKDSFISDIAAGLTVGVVALPLAMAFAIASGLPPQAGLFTAIIAGFLISALGGSRVQIGGPAGAFIVIVYSIVENYGVGSLLIATAMSGVLLFIMGLLKLGTLVKFIPVAVIIGFTNGIAVLIALSQIKDFLGLNIEKMPADFFGIVKALYTNINSTNFYALGIALFSFVLLISWRKIAIFISSWIARRFAFKITLAIIPSSIIALVFATLIVSIFNMPVETIGSKFGGIPAGLPSFALPEFTWQSARHLIIPTITLALLGSIESLLCARVADTMSHGSRHNPNQELMAQGVANFVTPFFGGMPATGTIARTVTNVKSGAVSPISGMIHAGALLLVVLVAAPLAASIPLAALAAILMFVAWNMGEWREFIRLKTYRMPYRVTLIAVFLLTVIFDLTIAVEFGIFAACITFIYRISSLSHSEEVKSDKYPEIKPFENDIQIWRLYGALFFGATKLIENLADTLPKSVLILDIKNVIYIDSTGIESLEALLENCRESNVRLVMTGIAGQTLDITERTGFLNKLTEISLDDVQGNLDEAVFQSVAILNEVS